MAHYAERSSSPHGRVAGSELEPISALTNEARSGIASSVRLERENLNESPTRPRRKRPRGESSRTAVAYSRKRAVAACRNCRVRKIKC